MRFDRTEWKERRSGLLIPGERRFLVPSARAAFMGASAGAPAVTPPSFRQIVSSYDGSAVNPDDLTTSGISWVSGDFVLAIGASNGSATLNSVVGQDGTDPDSYASIISITHSSGGPTARAFLGTVVSPFDATTRFTYSSARQSAQAVATIQNAGAAVSGTPSSNSGEDTAPIGLEITPAVGNCRVVCIVSKRGDYNAATPPTQPVGWDLDLLKSFGTNWTDTTSVTSLFVASKVFTAAAPTGNATWAIGGTARWVTIMLAIPPA